MIDAAYYRARARANEFMDKVSTGQFMTDGELFEYAFSSGIQAMQEEMTEEWEYAWEADETIRQKMNPRGPKIMIDGYFDTPDAIAAFPKGRRIRRRKAGPWEEVSE